jgi:hypothetical protein
MRKTSIYLAPFVLVLCLALAGGVQAADPNLVGWWPLNDGSGGTVADLSGRGTTGTINNPNGGLGADGSVWVTDAERGAVISFNGTATGAYVRAGSIPQMTLANDFTWAFWAKQDVGQTGSNDIILGNRKDENAVDFVPRQFIKFTPTKFEWHMNGNGNDNLDYADIPADVWLHHAVVKTGAELNYYRNGVAAGSKTFTQPLDFSQPLFFGGDNEAAEGENWRGLLSDARIYNKALTRLEVLAAMADVARIDMEIGYAVKPPVIDGEVDAVWAAASTHSFVPLADPADGSGTWKVLYDEENLYVLVDVTDDSLKNDSASSWQDDSVEVYFDGGNTKLSTPLSGDDHQYTFGWTADDIQGTNIAGATAGIEQGQVTTATGWRIEIKMPWLSIQGKAPEARDLIGIDCYYNDDDDGGDTREGKMLSFSAVEGWNDASQWATAILAAVPVPVDPGTTGLAAHYAFENDTKDSSGNGNDGMIVGNPTWIAGAYGKALEFHGLGAAGGGGDYVLCGSSPSLDITGPISLALWIKPGADDPEGKGTETAPMAKALSTASPSWSYQVRYGWGSPKPFMAFTFNTSPRAWVYVGQKLAKDEWSHIACSADGTTLKCYLDGVQTDSTPMGAITSSPAPILIGSDGWGCDWIGGIDEVAIYNRALSAEEILFLATPAPAPTVLFEEDFEGLPLGANVDEALVGAAVWTKTAPAGWLIDDSGMPGVGDPATDGVTEWAGWSFADKAWWTQTAEDQDRSTFTLASGTVAIADPDEWDDQDHAAGWFRSFLSTPAIDVTGVASDTLQLTFDSSWRPEFDDDYHQTAKVTVSFDGGAPTQLLLWESDEASPNYKPYATNEAVAVPISKPAGAQKMAVTFGLFDAGNDWWWAIDNVKVVY